MNSLILVCFEFWADISYNPYKMAAVCCCFLEPPGWCYKYDQLNLFWARTDLVFPPQSSPHRTMHPHKHTLPTCTPYHSSSLSPSSNSRPNQSWPKPNWTDNICAMKMPSKGFKKGATSDFLFSKS